MKYIVSVDQSTSSSKAFLIDANGMIVRRAARPHHQYYPEPGIVEHDAQEIFENVGAIIDEVTDGIALSEVAALSIGNQRETIVLWERETGIPRCRAIVWQDIRGKAVCKQLSSRNDEVRGKTGSDLSPYLPATKLAALFCARPDLRREAESGRLCAGTIEAYLVFRLSGGHFASDISNASRTQLLNLSTLQWDRDILTMLDLPECMLPERLLPSDAHFGEYKGIPITGVLGDSFATLFGQGCHTPGTVKTSYGTGTSVMMNIGNRPIILNNGLTTAIAFGYRGQTYYEIEGNITCSGDTLVWLIKGMELFKDADELEALAKSVPDAQGVRLVPALSGLGAPFFDTEARAVICGMSRGTTRAHIARAALESMAQRGADVFEVMRRDAGFDVQRLMVDGGGSKNDLLMQLQADLANCELCCPSAGELTALGSAYMAGLTVGVYASFEAIPARQIECRRYVPKMPPETREKMRAAWAKAIQCAQIG